MTDRYDVIASRKDKDGKWRNIKVGSAFPKGDRINVVLDALPIGTDGQSWLTLFPAKPKDDQSRDDAGPGRQSKSDMNDDIPF